MRKAIEEEFSRLGVTFVQGTAQVQADKRVVVKMAHMQKRTVGSGLSDDGKNPADILDTVIYEADKILNCFRSSAEETWASWGGVVGSNDE